MKAIRSVVHAVFGCQHEQLSRPFTIQQQSYMVCLECGRKVFYSIDEMRRLSRREVRRLQALPSSGVSIAAKRTVQPVADDPTIAA